MPEDTPFSASLSQEPSDILLTVVVCAGGTAEQQATTQESLKNANYPWLEIAAYPDEQTSSSFPTLPCRPDGTPDLQAGRGSYTLFLAPGSILLPEFFTDVPSLLQDSPDFILLASYANAERTWFNSVPKSETLLNDIKAQATPWCKLCRSSLLPHLPKSSAPLPVLLREMAICALAQSSHFTTSSSPLLVHPHQESLFSPEQGRLRIYKASLKHMVSTAQAFTQGVSPSESYKIRRDLIRFLFHEGLSLRKHCSFFQATQLVFSLGYQACKAVLSCGAKATATGTLGAYRQLKQNCIWSSLEHTQHNIAEREQKLRQKPVINVLFVAFSPPIWKVDSVMKAMLAHPRFNPKVLIVPEKQILSPETRRKQMDQTRRFMEERGYPVFELCDESGQDNGARIPDEYDILFYPKPYPNAVPAHLDYLSYPEKLWISIYYGFHDTCNPHFYEQPIQRFGWIDCYENESSAAQARLFKQRDRDNAVATGMPFVDSFLYPEAPHISPWKPQEGTPKRIIWAPHWTINPDFMHLSHFLEIAEDMSAMAERTIGRIQWAFKPHPLLYDTLCQHPDWGKERTDAYYARWESGENTQLETGDYVALFMHSDAMVHDSCSFCNDYHLSGKPVLFLARDLRTHMAEASPMTREAIMAQYIGKGMDDIEHFLTDTVLGGHDPMQAQRTAFRETHLVPPHGRSAAENLIEYILTGQITAS